MKFKTNLISMFIKELKQTPEAPQITEFLSENQFFRSGALKLHNMKLKFWQKFDEAAFPENYKKDKMIDQKKH